MALLQMPTTSKLVDRRNKSHILPSSAPLHTTVRKQSQLPLGTPGYTTVSALTS